MQLITHRSHLDAIPESPLKSHITARFDQLSEDTDVPPNIVLVEADDNITGPDYAFANGLTSDLFEEASPRESGFMRSYEWASYLPSLRLYEALLLVNNEDGYWLMIPEEIVEAPSRFQMAADRREPGRVVDSAADVTIFAPP